MSRKILVKPSATSDLQNIFDYFAENNLNIALKFFDSARQTFAQLAQMPNMGRLYVSDRTLLKGLRRWAVKDFKKYLIFYTADDVQIEVIRVIHAAQDIEAIFDNES